MRKKFFSRLVYIVYVSKLADFCMFKPILNVWRGSVESKLGLSPAKKHVNLFKIIALWILAGHISM